MEDKLPTRPYIYQAASYIGTEYNEFKKAIRKLYEMNLQLPELRILASHSLGFDCDRLVDTTIELTGGLPLLIVSGDNPINHISPIDGARQALRFIKQGYSGKWIYWTKQSEERGALVGCNQDSLILLLKYFDDAKFPFVMKECLFQNYDPRFVKPFSYDELKDFEDGPWLKSLEDFSRE